MEKSLPARPSLEQLKKQAKDLVKAHADKHAAALALIRAHLPAAMGKSDEEIARQSFALHDAQSVVARQHGFPSWEALREAVEKTSADVAEPEAPAQVQKLLDTALEARRKLDYGLLCTVVSPQFAALVTKEKFDAASARMDTYFKAEYRITYMGALKSGGRLVYFWRLWVQDWDSDILVRMSVNDAGQISALLYSAPFDSAMSARK